MKHLRMIAPGMALGAMLIAAPAFAEDTITIGMTLSQTGSLNVDSLAQQRGAELWRDEVNAAGGIKVGDKHYKVKFVTYDDQSQGGRVQQLYTRLIVQDKAQFLFSPYSSGLVGDGRGDQRAVRQDHAGHRRRRAQDLRARQQISVPGHHGGGSLSHRRGRGAARRRSKSQDRLRLFRRSVLQGGGGRGARPGGRSRLRGSCWTNPTPPRPPISARSSTRSSRRGPTRSWAAAIIPTARRWRASSTTRRPTSSGRRSWSRPATEVRQTLGRRRARRHGAVAMGAQASPTSRNSGRRRRSSTRRSRTKFNTEARLPLGLRLYRRRCCCSTPSSRPARSTRKRSRPRSTRWTSRPSSATSNSRTDAKHHGLQIAHDMVLAQWQKKDGKLTPRWSGPTRQDRRTSSSRNNK